MSLDLLLTIVSRTPLWAWAVLAALILIGVSQSRDRTMGSTRLLLLPLVVGALAISALVATGGSVAALLGLAIGAVAGGALALRIVRRDGAAQVARGTVRVKGEWLTLTILLGAFLTRYVAIVVAEVAPAAAASPSFQFGMMLLTGFLASVTVVRAALRLRLAYAEPRAEAG